MEFVKHPFACSVACGVNDIFYYTVIWSEVTIEGSVERKNSVSMVAESKMLDSLLQTAFHTQDWFVVEHAFILHDSSRLTGSHYSDVIMNTIASQITSLTIVYSTVYWSADQRKHQSSASLAFVRGIHR